LRGHGWQRIGILHGGRRDGDKKVAQARVEGDDQVVCISGVMGNSFVNFRFHIDALRIGRPTTFRTPYQHHVFLQSFHDARFEGKPRSAGAFPRGMPKKFSPKPPCKGRLLSDVEPKQLHVARERNTIDFQPGSDSCPKFDQSVGPRHIHFAINCGYLPISERTFYSTIRAKTGEESGIANMTWVITR